MVMKKLFLIAGLLLQGLVTVAQSNDPVIMKIAGEPVTRSEFEYNFNKNNTEGVIDKKSVEEYAELFVNYKLKVKAAEDANYDTLSSFQNEFRTYRDQLIRPMLIPEGAEEKEVRAYYDGMLSQLAGHDLRLPAHIFLRVPQKSSAEEQAVKKLRIDSIYQALVAGADFAETAKKFSEDAQSAVRGGELTWFGPGQLVPQFEEVMYKLNKGELSQPFLSTVGYHIVLLKDTKQLEPYDTLRPQILRFLESRGMREQLAGKAVDSLAMQKGVSIDQYLDQQTERLCATDDELKYLVKEYHDGLLMYEICNTQVWEPAAKDTAALENYFKKNKKQYAWKTPHYYGMLYYTRNSADVKAVQKLLKKVDEAKWTTTVRENFNKDSVNVRMQQKLFVQGDDAIVDSLAFGIKQGKTKARKDFPYSGLVGRKLKKGPSKWTDVGSQVVADLQKKRENEFVEDLRKRYEVVIYPEVLATVNKH